MAKFNRQSVEVIKGRCFLQLPLNLKNNDVDMPHTDTHHNIILQYDYDESGQQNLEGTSLFFDF